MDRVSIYEYDRKNRERVVKAIEEAGGQILSWSFFAKDQSKFELPPGTLSVFIDLSSLFYNEDRADALIAPAELLLHCMLSLNANTANKYEIYCIIRLMKFLTLRIFLKLKKTQFKISLILINLILKMFWPI